MNAGTLRSRVLFICADPVGDRMAGLGIRYSEMARVLADHADVTVAHGGQGSTPLAEGVATVPYRPHAPVALRPLIEAADVVVCHPQWPLVTGWLRRSRARVVFDLYDPESLETLELLADRHMIERRLMDRLAGDRLRDALRTGHHFMCASEKQRDLWLGTMLGLGMVDPEQYDRDPSFRSVIDVVPFGVPSQRPPEAARGPGPRERFAQIGPDADIVLWNGGLWRWLDVETAIRGVVALTDRRPEVKLVFMGGSRQPAALEATEDARRLALELGVLDRTVFFNDRWVPYGERAAWLAQAECALSTHHDHLESRYAFRTRMLDCFWAGVPVVCTLGDDLAERVEREELGIAVPPGDAHAVSTALEDVLDRGRQAYAAALARAAAAYEWNRVARPLLGWVTDPTPAQARTVMGRRLIPPAQRARALAYRLGGRHLLARRSR